MKQKKLNFQMRLFFAALLFCFSVQSFVHATSNTYLVREGDTLSKIAQNNLEGRIYGKHGNLARLRQLNPWIKDPNHILSGQKIIFPSDVARLPASSAEQNIQATPSPPVSSKPLQSSTPPSSAPSHQERSKEESADTDLGYSKLELSPEFFYSRIDGFEKSGNTRGALISNLNYRLKTLWRQVWSDFFESFLGGGLTRYEFESSRSRALEGTQQNSPELFAGFRFNLGSSSFTTALGTGEEIFYSAPSAGVISIHSVMVPQGSISFRQDFFKLRPFTLGAEASLRAFAPAQHDSFSVRAGWGYRAELFIQQESFQSPWNFKGAVFYSNKSQNTSILNAKQSDLGMNFSITWSFGK